MSKVKSLFLTEFDLHPEKKNVFDLAVKYFDESYSDLVESCDKVFVGLMIFQWLFSIGIAYWYSPYTYMGLQSKVHYHVWLALFGGGLLAAAPVALYFLQPKHTINRYVNVISQGLFSALLIHLTGGRIETHFHVFGSLAFFAFYRDLKVLGVGTLVVAADHLIRGIWFPQSVFGIVDASQWRWLEHAGWVVFEDFFLSYACIKSLYEMKIVALKRAETEDQKNSIEEIVQVRTSELSEEKKSMKNVLDTIDQGLFIIDKAGLIIGEPSKKSYEFFEQLSKGDKFATLIGKLETEYDELLALLFSGDMHPDSCLELFPKRAELSARTLRLSYKPIFRGETIDALLVTASDVTEVEKLQDQSRRSEERNKAIVKILSTKNEFIEATQMAYGLENMKSEYDSFKRQLHTLKGAFAFLECSFLAQYCHEMENSLPKDVKLFKEVASGIAVSLKTKVNKFIEDNNHILKLNTDSQSIEIELPRFSKAIEVFKKIDPSMAAVAEIDELLKVDIQDELSWLSDAFKQACDKLNKECLPIRFTGGVKIPTQIYKGLFKSFIHIVRNTADHGLEDPAEREMLGKNPAGQLAICLNESSTHYEIIFKDDGQGIDVAQLRKKLGPEAEALSDQKIIESIFLSGFTTKTAVSETSGRGVGLDAVRYEAQKLDGQCWAVNHEGAGLEIHVKFKKLKFSDHHNMNLKTMAA